MPRVRTSQIQPADAVFVGRQGGPEQAVIGVAPAVVADGGPGVFRDVLDVAEQLVDGQLLERRIQLGQGGVEPLDVTLVDATVVDLEGSTVDVGLECVVGEREVGERVPGHQPLLFLWNIDNNAITYCI